jgi:hypothetical protein
VTPRERGGHVVGHLARSGRVRDVVHADAPREEAPHHETVGVEGERPRTVLPDVVGASPRSGHMNFTLDENIPEEACDLLRQAGHDAQTAQAQGLSGSLDEVLIRAWWCCASRTKPRPPSSTRSKALWVCYPMNHCRVAFGLSRTRGSESVD